MANWRDSQFFGLILVLLAAFVFLVLVMTRRRALRFHARAIPTTATVFSSGYPSRTEVYFVDENGNDVDTSLTLTYPTQRGQRIEILYDPRSPKKAITPPADRGLSVQHRPEKGPLSLGWLGWTLVLCFLIPGLVLMLVPFGAPICDDPAFRDMDFCLTGDRPRP